MSAWAGCRIATSTRGWGGWPQPPGTAGFLDEFGVLVRNLCWLEKRSVNARLGGMSPAHPKPLVDAPDLFGANVSGPEGFSYKPGLFSAADKSRFVAQFQGLPFKPFEFRGYLGNRRIVSYGYRYDYAGRSLKASDPIPPFLEPLKQIASDLSGISGNRLQQALITEYAPGSGIGWHRDNPMFEDVVALSFRAPCVLRLRHRQDKGWARQSIEMAPRSGYVLHGPARNLWEHSITPVSALRYSVTFRSFRPDYSGAG